MLLRESTASLASAFRSMADSPGLEGLLPLLLGVGELECGLEDVRSPDAKFVSSLTDLAAAAALACDCGLPVDGAGLRKTAAIFLPQIAETARLSIARPEGFAYYALHPLDYADLIGQVHINTTDVLVVGVRSIGTTLSAVVTAQLRAMGCGAERTTVRPEGHPYDRRCTFDTRQREQIRRALSGEAQFVICDEGPGRSGSSLLSVAEALEREGVSSHRILLLCAHQPDVSTLCAVDAARRWSRYRVQASGSTRRLPADAEEDIGGGGWRAKFLEDEELWPAAWTQMEPRKYLSRDGKRLWKFEGHGQFGEQVRARQEALSGSGFGALYCGPIQGFGCSVVQPGRAGRRNDLSPELLGRIAEYCAWRARAFGRSAADPTDLEEATRVNYERAFGVSLEISLPIERPVVADGRMQPHEWFCTQEGRWLKLDGVTHGDDHFFPGPCDIAWDLAGVAIEWQLDALSREYFLSNYTRLSGDNVIPRIDNYEAAYAIFRLGWCSMAAASMHGSPDEERLLRDELRYRYEALRSAPQQHGTRMIAVPDL